MIKAIQFNDQNKFDHTDDNNLMDIITRNCIILCEDVDIKRFLSNEIIKICCGEYMEDESVLYDTESDDEPKLTKNFTYFPTSLLKIDDEQRIVVTIEAPFILTATDVHDIWYAGRTNANKVIVYPLRVFKGHMDDWNQGVEKIYINTIHGRYGVYSYNKDFDPDETLYHFD